MKWTVWLAAVGLASAAQARMVPARRRHNLGKRQFDSAISDNAPSTQQQGQDTGLLDGLLPTDDANTRGGNSVSVGPAASPNPLLPPVQSVASVPNTALSSRSTPGTSRDGPSSSSSSARPLTSPSTGANVQTTNIFSTQSVSESSVPENQQNKDDDEGSGIGKKTLIIVISVASAVGLVAAIWTILRKWKFSPSRKFEDRLNPIDWDPHAEVKDEKPAERSPSVGSGTLVRENSWGSSRGAAMSEVTGYSRPPPSAANGYNGTAPGYPPSYSSRGYVPEMPQQYPSQHSLANSYEYPSVTRQGAQVNGGRYGEGYQ